MHFLVDTHVHIYPEYQLTQLFDKAAENFSLNAKSLERKLAKQKKSISAKDMRYAMLLTETNKDNAFADLLIKAKANERIGDWQLEVISDEILMCKNTNSISIYLVLGQQVITKERLELSLWASSEKSWEGMPARDIIEKALAEKSMVAIPWGVAKWFGNRGQLVLSLMNTFGSKIVLSDNSGRPFFWTRPQHFKLAAHKSIAVLAGSDVLPVVNGEHKVARYISVCESDVELTDKQSLASILAKKTINIGKLASFQEFFRDQLAMQQRKNSG